MACAASCVINPNMDLTLIPQAYRHVAVGSRFVTAVRAGHDLMDPEQFERPAVAQQARLATALCAAAVSSFDGPVPTAPCCFWARGATIGVLSDTAQRRQSADRPFSVACAADARTANSDDENDTGIRPGWDAVSEPWLCRRRLFWWCGSTMTSRALA